MYINFENNLYNKNLYLILFLLYVSLLNSFFIKNRYAFSDEVPL